MPTSTPRIRAVIFDAFGTLFDVYSVGALAEQLFPGKGDALAALWRQKQIEYAFIRTLSGRYKPFLAVTEDGLVFAASKLGLELSEGDRRKLMNQYACLSPFPENLGVLKALRERGLPLAILSNGTPEMLDVAVRSAGMHGLFDHVLSVERVGVFKTHADAYALGTQAFGCTPQEIVFVSSNGWDAIGATWFGYTSFWVNRGSQPCEQLDVTPTATGATLDDLLDFVTRRTTTGTAGSPSQKIA
jgi:2-haloacid dehalogenase